jgi:hypothetical protein
MPYHSTSYRRPFQGWPPAGWAACRRLTTSDSDFLVNDVDPWFKWVACSGENGVFWMVEVVISLQAGAYGKGWPWNP